MRKPCTDCPEYKKTQITSVNTGRKSTSGTCMAGRDKYFPSVRVSLGYYEMIAYCVDYAEWLAWQREHRKKRKNGTIKKKASD